jgi:predicted transposase/invertase (TIGR01784 family)
MKTAIIQAVQWCIANNILKPFLERNGSEVINMLFGEWKLEDALVVEREEGIEEGLERGLERGRGEGRVEIAKNALGEGVSVEFIQKITGLSTETIQSLATR